MKHYLPSMLQFKQFESINEHYKQGPYWLKNPALHKEQEKWNEVEFIVELVELVKLISSRGL